MKKLYRVVVTHVVYAVGEDEASAGRAAIDGLGKWWTWNQPQSVKGEVVNPGAIIEQGWPHGIPFGAADEDLDTVEDILKRMKA